MLSTLTDEKLITHLGHDISIVMYGNNENVALECNDCYELLADCDMPSDQKVKRDA